MYTIVYVYKNGVRKEVAKYDTLEKTKKDVKKSIEYLIKYNSVEDRVSIDIEKEMIIEGYTTMIKSYKIKEQKND